MFAVIVLFKDLVDESLSFRNKIAWVFDLLMINVQLYCHGNSLFSGTKSLLDRVCIKSD